MSISHRYVVQDNKIVCDTDSGQYNHIVVDCLSDISINILCLLLNQAYDYGKKDKAQEIRNVLGVN